ncbi:MAG TPA: hypothetical protein VFW65_21920 [Pseudonocardiaceae bacterium]|nr:hypothetical protein [Pseudonocardiaceae bacterium]
MGTSTVVALIGETIAAGSPGPTLVLDQCGSRWGSLARRLLGQRAGLSGERAHAMLRQGIPAVQVYASAPATSAGAAVVTDGAAYTPTAEMFRLAHTACGATVIDGGSVDLTVAVRLDLSPVVVLVGRADVIGAEAVCAALGFLSRYTRARPVVVLSSPTAANQRRVHAARKLVATTGVAHLVSLPFDARLTAATPLRLDQVGKTTASACLRMVTGIGQTQEVLGYVR